MIEFANPALGRVFDGHQKNGQVEMGIAVAELADVDSQRLTCLHGSGVGMPEA